MKLKAKRRGLRWPPEALADVATQARAAADWAADRRDVAAVSVALAELPPNARPVLLVTFLFIAGDGRRYRVTERFECARPGTGATAAWVKNVLTRRVRAVKRGLAARDTRPANGDGKGR